jgi:hypothetical protein
MLIAKDQCSIFTSLASTLCPMNSGVLPTINPDIKTADDNKYEIVEKPTPHLHTRHLSSYQE